MVGLAGGDPVDPAEAFGRVGGWSNGYLHVVADDRYGWVMSLRLARTNAEAHMYMELHPCESCGETDFDPVSSVIMIEGDLGSRYRGFCPRCGTQREFTFRIPDDATLPDEEEPSFGGDDRSELLDPGEWMWVADVVASGSPANPDGLSAEQRRNTLLDLRTAAAAMSEVIKFVPDGEDRVPLTSFWSARGRQVYGQEPGRFRLGRLEVVHRAYRELAERFAD